MPGVKEFGKIKTTNKGFYYDNNKRIININDFNINEILVSKGLFPKIINLNDYVIGYIITTSNHYISNFLNIFVVVRHLKKI